MRICAYRLSMTSISLFIFQVFIIFALLISFCPQDLRAGDNRWSSIGPFGGTIETITFHPTFNNIAFASSIDATFISRDGGQRWSRTSPLQCIEVFELYYYFPLFYRILPILRIHPQAPNVVFAGCNNFYRSSNNGTTWTTLGKIPSGFISDFEFDPRSPDVIYAVTRSFPPFGSPRKPCAIFKSIDAGQSWVSKLSGPICDSSQIEIDSKNPNVLYSWIGKKFYKSTTAGDSWQVINQLLSGSQLLADPNASSILYAVGNQATKIERGLFKSENAGRSWQLLQKGASAVSINRQNSLQILTINDKQLFKSVDAGRTFSQLGITPQDVQPFYVAIHPAFPGRIFFTDLFYGVFRSINGGASWQASNRGIDLLDIDKVAANSKLANQVFAVVGGKLFQSTNRGASWKVVPLNDGLHTDVEIHPKNPNLIVTNSILSTDAGKTWTAIKYPDRLYDTGVDVALDPENEKIIYIATYSKGVIKSTDGGETWKQINSGLPAIRRTGPISIAPKNGSVLYVVAGNFGNLYKSSNGGANWKHITNGLPDEYWVSISMDPDNLQAVFVTGNQSGPFRSTDGGATWQAKSNGVSEPTFVEVGPANSPTVFTGTQPSLLISRDNGENWAEFDVKGLPPYRNTFVFRDLAFSSAQPNLFYAATTSGIFSYTQSAP
jgi:photosystem II stability/assembly factor-like uncharacterized protein